MPKAKTTNLLVLLKNAINEQFSDNVDHFAYSLPGHEIHVWNEMYKNFTPVSDTTLPVELFVFVFNSATYTAENAVFQIKASFFYASAEKREQTFLSWQKISAAFQKFENTIKSNKGLFGNSFSVTQDTIVLPGFNAPCLRFDCDILTNIPCCLQEF